MHFKRSDLPNILVVCGRNKRRSRTAEYLYKTDSRFNIRSAGVSEGADRRLTAADLAWADLVLVMEPDQRTRIWDTYRNITLPPIDVLHIEDEYGFMNPDLIDILTDKIEGALKGVG